jgi:hypothetical protein
VKESSFVASTVVVAVVFKLKGVKMKMANVLGSNFLEPKILIFNAEKTHPSEVAAEDSIEIINQIDPTI